MSFNLTPEHFVAFVCLVYVAGIFFRGFRLIRMIVWIGLWQLITPVRGFLEDSLMLGCGFWVVEYCYMYAVKRIRMINET